MGFMDKAKKLAEQAQQKLDEAQENFNQGGSTPGQQAPADAPAYDQHGRPAADAPPAAEAPAPSAEPAEPEPEPPASPAAEAPAPDPAAPDPPSAPSTGGSPNSTPDPFRPLQK